MNAEARCVCLLGAVVSAVLAVRPVTAVGEPVVTTVEWVDDTGQKGTGQFEGLVDATTIAGRLRLGGERLVLEGTVDAEGEFTGTIRLPEGGDVAAVTGTVGENWSLGEFTVTGLPGGTWQALVDDPS